MINTSSSTNSLALSPLEKAIEGLRQAGPLPADRLEPGAAIVRALLDNTVEPGHGSEPPDVLFRRLIVATLSEGRPAADLALVVLRVLPIWPEVAEAEDRVAVVNLVERELGPAFQNLFQKQGHEVVRQLAKAWPDVEKNLANATAQLTSLERVGACRKAVMKALHQSPNKHFLIPYLPASIDALLGDFFSCLSAYAERWEETDALALLDRYRQSAGKLGAELTATETAVSSFLNRDVLARANLLVHAASANSPAAQPAALEVSYKSRTYPLHLEHNTFLLPIIILNAGSGFAHSVVVTAVSGEAASLAEGEYLIGPIRPGTQYRLEISVTINAPVREVAILVQVTWSNFDGSKHEDTVEVLLKAQRTDIDWASIRQNQAYSLEPVSSAMELVGREDMMSRLVSLLDAAAAGSCLLTGQKRVGKTSLAKALQSKLSGKDFTVLYIESGDYVHPTPSETIKQLGKRIARILSSNSIYTHVPVPEFGDSLAPLADYFDDLTASHPASRFLIVLDEFDELSPGLYARDPIGNAFFLGLRSLSSRSNVGLLLVGGERMSHILENQADKLNKFTQIGVDYFRKDRDWEDYRQLVQAPTADILEFDDKAVHAIFDTTNGNPYFTHLLCQELLRAAINRRDCVITTEDVERGTVSLLCEAERNSFQHFWEDGIVEVGEAATERSSDRRRTLIALSDALRLERPASIERIEKQSLAPKGVASVLHEFCSRGILASGVDRRVYQFTVPLFDRWLAEKGLRVLLKTLAESDSAVSARQSAEALRPTLDEIRKLVANWPPYRGQTVTESRVQAWLAQFETPKQQRDMLSVLTRVRFFSQHYLRKKMREVHSIIQSSVEDRIGSRKLSPQEILVSYLDGPGKSGAAMARLLVDELSWPGDVVVERAALREGLSDPKVRGLVFVDDFAGTGESLCRALQSLHDDFADIVRSRDIRVVVVPVVGHVGGVEAVRQLAEELRFGVRVHCCEMLDAAELFSEQSAAFEAKETAQVFGARLQKNAPLGYGGLGLAVVFEHGCPNNSLPVLHAEGPDWTPLFKRL